MSNEYELIRTALRANTAFSMATGLVLAIAPGTVRDWLGVSINGWLRLFGLALIGHAIVLGVVSTQPKVQQWARINLAMIAPYPILMIGVVAAGLVERPLGVALVLVDGAVIAMIAAIHGVGLRREPSTLHAQAA